MSTINVDRVVVVDEQERVFEAVLSAEMTDNQGLIVSPAEVKKFIDVYIKDRDGPVTDQHSNRVVGKVLDWWEDVVLVDDALIERAVKANPKNASVRGVLDKYLGESIPVIMVRARIHKNYDGDDEVWSKLKSGEYTGVSFGGRGEGAVYDEKHGGIRKALNAMWEVAVVDAPRVAIALLSGINDIAQSDDAEALRDHCKGCCPTCGVGRGEDNIMQKEEVYQGRKYIKSPSEAPKGAKVQKGARGGYYYEDKGGGAEAKGPEGKSGTPRVSGEAPKKPTTANRIKSRIKKLTESGGDIDREDAQQFQMIIDLLQEGDAEAAQNRWRNMDSAARDDFLLAFVDGGRDTAAIEKFEMVFDTKIHRENLQVPTVDYKGYTIGEIDGMYYLEEDDGTRFFPAVDDSKHTGGREVNEELNSEEGVKKFIDEHRAESEDTEQGDALTTGTEAAHNITHDKDTEEFKKEKPQSPNHDTASEDNTTMKKDTKQADAMAPETPEPSPLDEILQRLDAIDQRLTALETPAEAEPELEQQEPGAQEGDKEPAPEIDSAAASPDESKDVAQRDRSLKKVAGSARPANDIKQGMVKGLSAVAIARGQHKPTYAQIREEVL